MDKTNTVNIVREEAPVTSVTITLTARQAAYLNLLFYKHLPSGTANLWLGEIYHQLWENGIGTAKSLNQWDYSMEQLPRYEAGAAGRAPTCVPSWTSLDCR